MCGRHPTWALQTWVTRVVPPPNDNSNTKDVLDGALRTELHANTVAMFAADVPAMTLLGQHI